MQEEEESGKASAKRQKLQHHEGESGGPSAANDGSAVCSSIVCQTTAKQLQAKLATAPSIYGTTTADVIQVLHIWDKQFAHVSHMSSFLRTESRLLHETEECIVALHHFKEWWDKQREQSTSSSTSITEPLTVVDVGCGKGYYSMFLSYLIGFVWNKQDTTTTTTRRRPIQSIILIDKTSRQEINWSHLDTANQMAQVEGRPHLELWDATNLHHYDALVDRLQARRTRLAITGVHLCKMLSPALISLVNGLRDICDYCCLAPCCLPRSVTKGKCRLAIYQYETPEVRQRRLQFKAQRQVSRTCALCGSNQHVASACPTAPPSDTNDDARTQVLHQAMQTLPCWKCGTLGHFAAQCTLAEKQRVTPRARTWIVPAPPAPPTDKNDNNNNPFEMYCRVLAQAFEGKTTQIVHAGLVNDKVAKHGREDDKKNWNGQRKSVFLVATTD